MRSIPTHYIVFSLPVGHWSASCLQYFDQKSFNHDFGIIPLNPSIEFNSSQSKSSMQPKCNVESDTHLVDDGMK